MWVFTGESLYGEELWSVVLWRAVLVLDGISELLNLTHEIV